MLPSECRLQGNSFAKRLELCTSHITFATLSGRKDQMRPLGRECCSRLRFCLSLSLKRSIELSQTWRQCSLTVLPNPILQSVLSLSTRSTPELTESFEYYQIWHLAKPGTLATECDHIQRCYQCLRTGPCWGSRERRIEGTKILGWVKPSTWPDCSRVWHVFLLISSILQLMFPSMLTQQMYPKISAFYNFGPAFLETSMIQSAQTPRKKDGSNIWLIPVLAGIWLTKNPRNSDKQIQWMVVSGHVFSKLGCSKHPKSNAEFWRKILRNSPFSGAIFIGVCGPFSGEPPPCLIEVQQWSTALLLMTEMRQKFVPPNVAWELSTAGGRENWWVEHGGFHKWGYPKMVGFKGKSH